MLCGECKMPVECIRCEMDSKAQISALKVDALEMAITFCDKNSDIDYKVFRCFESEKIGKVW